MNWAYIAGFFDGEGSVSVGWNKAQRGMHIQLRLCQSGPEGLSVLEEIKEFMAQQEVRSITCKHNRDETGRRPMHVLIVSSRDSILRCLVGMLPYLRVKRVKAQDLWRFLRMYPSLRSFSARVLNRGRAKVPLDVLVAEYRAGASVEDLVAKHNYCGTQAIYKRFRENGVPLYA